MIKRVLITGTTSYIGNQLAAWLEKEPENYEVTKISVRNNRWKSIDFSVYDVVVHVAGIAHQDTKANQESLYYKINTDLTIKLANKAKSEGIKQFIFMSSIIVYGASGRIGATKVITNQTIPKPINFYGNSKLLAEEKIKPLQSDIFDVVIIRPPMIYGENSKGNYPILANFARNSPVFPDIDNQRSMLHIDNLNNFIQVIINKETSGTFFPQNKEYVKTSDLVKNIANINGKKIWMTKIFNPIINLMFGIEIINKIFGNLTYEKNIGNHDDINFIVRNFKESIELTEN